jgi:hypothetical protein
VQTFIFGPAYVCTAANLYTHLCSEKKISLLIKYFYVEWSLTISSMELLQLQTVVKRAIAMEQATDALIDLIKEHGRWVDPPVED